MFTQNRRHVFYKKSPEFIRPDAGQLAQDAKFIERFGPEGHSTDKNELNFKRLYSSSDGIWKRLGERLCLVWRDANGVIQVRFADGLPLPDET